MIISTFNIRGSVNSMKKRRIAHIIRKHNPDVMFFQEAKVVRMVEDVVTGLWGSKDFDWSAKDVVGRSGGILIVWRKGAFLSDLSFSRKGFLGLRVKNKG